MTLGDLLNLDSDNLKKIEIKGITSDSRQVQPGFVYIAIEGLSSDGHDFIENAVESGAVVVLGSKDIKFKCQYIKVENPRATLSIMASKFYDEPSKKIKVVGITGTSGKTTLTYLLESIFSEAGQKVGVIGTVNFRLGSKVWPSTHTTPDPVGLQKIIAEMVSFGCETLVMEVSSHALSQHRVDGIYFDAVGFLNLSQDHLDYHETMDEYFDAKKILFTDRVRDSRKAGKDPLVVINTEHEYGIRLRKELNAKDLIDCQVPLSWQMDRQGISGKIGHSEFHSPLIARFNAENIAVAVAISLGMGLPDDIVAKGLSQMKGVPGRLERVGSGMPLVLVDYAHKPDALKKVLETLVLLKSGKTRLFTVVGCGGDRDQAKRPIMGKIAVEFSDHVVFTSDNPRREDPKKILQQITEGAKGFENFTVVEDRKLAIASAIQKAKSQDIVLIAGKGHEDYQILADPTSPDGTKKIPFDDCEVASQYVS